MKIKEALKVRDIETQHPESIAPDASVMEAAQLMHRLDIGALPVCEGNLLVGVVTDRDITIRATSEGKDPRQTRVHEVMSSEPVCCFEDQDVSVCVELMQRKQIRRIPVINPRYQLVGIISLGDLALRSHNDQLANDVLNSVSTQPLPASLNQSPRP